MNTKVTPTPFSSFPIHKQVIENLNKNNILYCTSIQAKSLSPMLTGQDVIAEAPTGTGKTFAFGIPIIQAANPRQNCIQGLILAPTRELVQQISGEIEMLSQGLSGISTLAIFGGESISKQKNDLQNHPTIIIATPGRLIDHIKRKNISLVQVRTLVIDEADRMLDMGFIDDVKFILKEINSNAQIALYTATLSREVLDISWLYQNKPVEIRVDASQEDKPSIKEYFIVANGSERIDSISDLLKENKSSKALVFVNMKQSADITARKLRDIGYSAESLQGDMPQNQRTRVMNNFRTGKTQILVGTDVAARGLDVEQVDIVFNYDLPLDTENYVHRIGRTGRAGQEGIAVSFLAPGEKDNFDKFCRRLRINPEQYPWKRPEKKQNFISSELEEEVVRRIRANSEYLKSQHSSGDSRKPKKHRNQANRSGMKKIHKRSKSKTHQKNKLSESNSGVKHREF